MNKVLETVGNYVVGPYVSLQRTVGRVIIGGREALGIGLAPEDLRTLQDHDIDTLPYHDPEIVGRRPTLVLSTAMGVLATVAAVKAGVR